MATWYRPLLFASIDPEAAEARGVPVRRLGLMLLVVLALTVAGAAEVVATLLVLSLAITPGCRPPCRSRRQPGREPSGRRTSAPPTSTSGDQADGSP